jgi:uncharacterized protein (TIGR03382 family)
VKRLFALGALVLASVPLAASAYVRSRVPTTDGTLGPELFWCVRSLKFTTNEKGCPEAGADATIAAVQLGFYAWNSSGCSDWTFEDGGTTPRTDIGFDSSSDATDNINLVVWRETLCANAAPAGDPCFANGGCNNKYDCWEDATSSIALTTTTFDKKTGEVYDADMELNGASFIFTTVDSPPCTALPARPPPLPGCVATDIRNTVTHESGHVFGLDHNVTDPSVTMYPSASLGDTNKRTPHPDDIAGLCDIYPLGKTTQGCEQKNGCGCGAPGAPLAGLAGLILAAWGLRRRRR